MAVLSGVRLVAIHSVWKAENIKRNLNVSDCVTFVALCPSSWSSFINTLNLCR
jgi:hypothetical protein